MTSSNPSQKWLALLSRWAPPLLLMVAGVQLCMNWGFRGFFAIDQSIVWHGAVRWMNGDLFVNDFRTPNGFTPIVMQAILFQLFGMNWYTYVFHAGLVNGAFGVIVFSVLKRLGGPRWLSFVFALLSMLVFYAPMATPFMDQHAYFFSMWAVLLAMKKSGLPLWRRRLEWALLPVAVVLAVASKQIPTAFFLPVVAYALLTSTARRQWIEAAASMGVGTALALCILCWWFPPWKTDFQLLRVTVWEIPSSVGDERWGKLGFHKPYGLLRQLFTDPFDALNLRKEFYRIVLMVVILGAAVAPLLVRFVPRLPKAAFRPLRQLPLVLLIQLAGGFSLALTQNNRENSIPYVYLTLGGIAVVIWAIGKEWNGRWWTRAVSICLVAFVLGNGIWDAVGFWRYKLEPRTANDFTYGEFDLTLPSCAPSSIQELSTLNAQGPLQFHYHNMDSLVIYLRSKGESFILWSDYTIVYDLCGQRDPLPWLWLHPGLTIPQPGSSELHAADSTILDALQKSDLLVLQSPTSETYMQADLMDYPLSAAWVEENAVSGDRLPGFYVADLKP
jgi:hypothetical protein